MAWLAFSLVSIAFWGAWGVVAKIALRHASWGQVTLLHGLTIALLMAAVLPTLERKGTWSWNAILMGLAVGVLGGAGTISFYLALDRGGKASIVGPVVGLYPVVTVALALLFLSERITTLQLVGIVFAIAAIVLISLGR